MFELICISNGTNNITVVNRNTKEACIWKMPFKVDSLACFKQFLVISDGNYVFYGMDLDVDKEVLGAQVYKRLLSDTIVRVFAFQNQFWIFGDACIERWNIVEIGPDRMIKPIEEGNIYHGRGLVNKYSVIQICGTLYWINKQGLVYRYNPAEGIQSINASILGEYMKSQIDKKITRLFQHEQHGHIFLGVQLTKNDAWFVWDVATGIWTKMKIDSNQLKESQSILTTPVVELNEDVRLRFNRLKVETTPGN